MTHCKSCGEPIDWVKTPAGKNMPVDLDQVTVVTKDGQVVVGRTPHWATCPNADQHRTASRRTK